MTYDNDFPKILNLGEQASELPEKPYILTFLNIFKKLGEEHDFGGTQIWTQNRGFSSFEPRKPIYNGCMTLIVSHIDRNSFPTDSGNMSSIRQLLLYKI